MQTQSLRQQREGAGAGRGPQQARQKAGKREQAPLPLDGSRSLLRSDRSQLLPVGSETDTCIFM